MLLGCKSARFSKIPELGETIEFGESDETFSLMVSSAGMAHTKRIEVEGCEFSVSLYGSINMRKGELYSISTSDPAFRPPENISIGGRVDSIPDFSLEKIIKENGWAYYVKLQSGWNAAFTIGSTMTEGTPTGDEPIAWFFKRR